MVGVAVVGDLIVEASPSRVRCLRASTGLPLWDRQFGTGAGHWPHVPVVAGSTVYAQITVGGTEVVALGLRDGRLRWRHVFPWGVDFEAGNDVHRVGPISVAGGQVLGVVPTGVQGTTSPALVCWQANTGEELWRRSVPWTNDPLVVVDGVACLIGDDHAIHGYALSNGDSLWRHVISPNESYGPWQPGHGEIITGLSSVADQVALAGIDARKGTLRWQVPLPHAQGIGRLEASARPDEIFVTAWALRGGANPPFWLYKVRAPTAKPGASRQSEHHSGRPDAAAGSRFFTCGASLARRWAPVQQLFYHLDALGTVHAYSNPDGSTNFRPLLDARGGSAAASGRDTRLQASIEQAPRTFNGSFRLNRGRIIGQGRSVLDG